MKITLGEKREPERHQVAGTDIVLLARRPTYAERIKECVLSGEEWLKVRLGCICGWEGAEFVDANDKPIAFSQNALVQACESVDGLFDEAVKFSSQMYRGIDRGNLQSPSTEAAATTETK